MDAPTDASRHERIDETLAIAAARLPAERQAQFGHFARECIDQLDDDDLAERSAEDLAGALLSSWSMHSRAKCPNCG